MSKRRFEQSMNPREHIQSELKDAGISHLSEWREALDLETPFKKEVKLESNLQIVKTKETKTETKRGVIEDEHWQKRLDTAFEQDNFDLIKTLQKVRPDCFPNPELVRSRLNSLVASRQGRWDEIYVSIKEISAVEPDVEVVKAEFSKLFERCEEEYGVLDDLKVLIEITGLALPQEQIQQKYRRLFNERGFFRDKMLLKDIYNWTGIKPDLSLIQEIIDRDEIEKVGELSSLFRFGIIKEMIQQILSPLSLIEKTLSKGKINGAKELASFFELEITSEMIQRAYEKNFEKNGYIDKDLIFSMGEKPNPELVHRAYQKIIEKNENKWLDSIKSLEQATGIKPVLTKEQIQSIFDQFLKNGWHEEQKGYVNIHRFNIKCLDEVTGIKPPIDFIQKVALKIIDDSHQYIDRGKIIKERLERLQEDVGIKFEIPELEIQERYQKAITDKKAYIIINLYGAFGIKPKIKKEVARQFMLTHISDTYNNPISDLEDIFGFKFIITNDEVESVYDNRIERMIKDLASAEIINNIDSFKQIKKLTGKSWNQERVTIEVIEFLEKKLLSPEHLKTKYESWGWVEIIKQYIEGLGITISNENVLQLYERLIDSGAVYSKNFAQLYEITGVSLPSHLAQQLYLKIISPDYVKTAITEGNENYTYDQLKEFIKIFEISGIKAQVPENFVQQFYRPCLELRTTNFKSDIQKIIEITGIDPVFDSKDVNQLYKKLILNGEEYRIGYIKEITSIELQFDEETVAYISQQIEAGIEKAYSGDYEKDARGGGGREFDTYSLKQDLRKVSSLTVATDVKPNPERLQLIYSEILANDPYCVIKIEQIVRATGIKPVFNSEQLQARGQQFLEQGLLRSFESLREYGEFTITPEVVIKAYDVLLANNRYYDEYYRKHRYNEDWIDRIKRLKKIVGIAPTENQLVTIFFHISQDNKIAQSRYGDSFKEKIKFFVENFQIEMTSEIVRDIVIFYFSRGDVNSIEKFIKEIDTIPKPTNEDPLPHVDRLLEAREIDSPIYLKQEMKLAHISANETIVQDVYQHFVAQNDFEKDDSKSFQAFKQIFEFIGLSANFSVKQIDQIYKTARFTAWQKLNEVIGVLPSNEAIQYKYLQFFTNSHYNLDQNIADIQILTGQSFEAETVAKALEHFALEGEIEKMSNIVKIAGDKSIINPEFGQKAYRKIIEQFNYYSLSTEELIVAIDFLNDKLGIRPDSETMYQIYNKTIDKTYNYKNSEGNYVYLIKFWKFLINKFGKPDPEVIQRIYLDQLATESFHRGFSKFYELNNIESLTGVKPDIQEMIRIEQARGIEIEGQQIDNKLQNLFQQELLTGNIEIVLKLEEQFNRQFAIEPTNLQVLYTQVLIEMGRESQQNVFRFLLERTGIAPSSEIIQACYRELFAEDFRPENIGDFQKMVEVPPSVEIIQEKYREVFEDYIKTYNYFYDYDNKEGYEDCGDRYFEQYTQLIQATGIKPRFDRDYVFKLYEFCVTHGSQYHQKLSVIAQETGVIIDQDFIQKYLLDNTEFSSPISLSISHDQLNKHFSNSQNKSLGEYKRIYQIFRCFDYYQGVLANLEQDKSRGAKKQVIAILASMGLQEMDNEDRYVATKDKLMSFVEEKSTPINKSLGEALAELAKNGDADLLNYLASTLRERTKSTKVKEEERGVMGFSPIQEVSLRTLFHVDNPVANEHLFALLSVSDIDPRVRSLVLKNLVIEKNGFFPDNMCTWVKTELIDKKSKFLWEDLKYFQAINQIPSADLRKKSFRHLNVAFGSFIEDKISPSEFQKKVCESVPDNIFLSLWKFTRGDQILLERFNDLYKTIKTSAEKDALLFGIVNVLSINKKTLDKVVNHLSKIDLMTPGITQELSAVLKTLNFLDIVERELGQSREETLIILDSPVESLRSLNESLKQVAVQRIKEVLPHEEINTDGIRLLWERWGSLEPIFVYAGKMTTDNYNKTLRLVAEMVVNMDAPKYEGWKRWRYNVEDRKVQEQIGHLTESQLEVWKDDHFAELGDIMIASTPSDKPKQILRFIEGSLREGHIYNSQIHASDRHKFIQEKLGSVYATISEHPDQREIILNGAVESLRVDIEKIDAIIRFINLSKLEQVLAFFAEGKNVPVNAKTKNSIGFLDQFLPKEQFQKIERTYKEVEKSEVSTVDASRIVDSIVKELLMSKIEEIKTKYEEILRGDIFEQYGLNKEQIKNISQFYQKRQELKALIDLYRISALDVKRIATNRISDHVDKKGETLIKVIEGLKIYFKDNPTFVQDIENIHAVISQRENLGAKRRLAMIITDNPQILFQAGKYPTGCGSCQNYEGSPDWNRALAGYVSDAHIKVAYLVDLNKLPDSLKNEIESKGFEEIKETIPHQDLLEASIARAITKITKISENSEPTLFIEPTYSAINKGDLTMDKYFNIFLELMVSEPMGIRLTRGGGSERVRVPKSRNPNGQYEDCAAGNAGYAGMGIQTSSYTMSARFIDRFTPVTDADRQLAERISGK